MNDILQNTKITTSQSQGFEILEVHFEPYSVEGCHHLSSHCSTENVVKKLNFHEDIRKVIRNEKKANYSLMQLINLLVNVKRENISVESKKHCLNVKKLKHPRLSLVI